MAGELTAAQVLGEIRARGGRVLLLRDNHTLRLIGSPGRLDAELRARVRAVRYPMILLLLQEQLAAIESMTPEEAARASERYRVLDQIAALDAERAALQAELCAIGGVEALSLLDPLGAA